MTDKVEPTEAEVAADVPEEEGEKYDGGEIPSTTSPEEKDNK